MSKLHKLLYRLTGGRPMVYADEWFVDCYGWNEADLYVDKLGRKWLAHGRWGFRRERL